MEYILYHFEDSNNCEDKLFSSKEKALVVVEERIRKYIIEELDSEKEHLDEEDFEELKEELEEELKETLRRLANGDVMCPYSAYMFILRLEMEK